jgi:prolyl 4-hydroxylase
MSPEECDHLLHISEGRQVNSTVVDNATGSSIESDYRTGFLTMLRGAEDSLVDALERRISQVSRTRVEQGEPIQIIGYKRWQKYKPHHDWFDPGLPSAGKHLAQGGQRIRTVMVYLKAPTSGGETEFTKLKIKVKPEVGAALMWDNTMQDGGIDHRTMHTGLPVQSGQKVVATRWIRERAFDGSENNLSSAQLNERLCAAHVDRIVVSYGCEMKAHAFISPRTGRVQAMTKIYTKRAPT